MNSEIKIVDNFLEEQEFIRIENDMDSSSLRWTIQRSVPNQLMVKEDPLYMEAIKSSPYYNSMEEFLNSQVKQNQLDFLYSNIVGNNYYNSYLYDKVVRQLDEDPNNYRLDRIYFNGQWNGREGDFHVDGNDFTALIYMSPYEYGLGGFTEFLTTPEPTLVYPIPNRLVIFPGNILHKAYSLAYQNCQLRVSLAFKIFKNPNKIWI